MAWRKPANLHEWTALLGRHKKKMLFPILGVMIAVVLASFSYEREYSAEAKFQRQSNPSMDGAGSNILRSTLTPLRRRLMEDLAGRAAIEQLIEDLGMGRDLPHTADGALTYAGQLRRNDLVQKLQSRLSIRQEQSEPLDQITVTFTDPDREMAPKVVNQLVENYLRQTHRELDETLLMGKAFFEKEVDRYRAMVQELEGKQIQFRVNHAGLMPDDPSSVQNKLVELRATLSRVVQELDVKRAERGKLDEWVKRQPDEIQKKQTVQNPALTQLLTLQTDLQKDLDQQLHFLGRTEEHPLVKKTRQRLADIAKQIGITPAQSEGPSTSEPNTTKIDSQRQLETMAGTITALTRQRDELSDQIEKFEMLDRNFVVVRAEFTKIQRDLEDAGSQLKVWEENLNRTTIALKAELGARGVTLVFNQRADIARPKSPTFAGVVAAAVVLGLGVGAGILLLAELTDHSFRTVNQAIDELKLPVLGAITEIITPANAMRRKVYSWAVVPAVGVAMVLVLLFSVWLVYLSLQDTQRFEQLIHHPGQYVFERLSSHNS